MKCPRGVTLELLDSYLIPFDLVPSWTNKMGCFISHKFNVFIPCGVLMVHICCVLANSRVSNNLLLYLIFNL